MTLIQEIINRRLFDEDQKYRSSVLKNEWISRQSRNILASLLIVSSLLQLMLSVVLVLQNAVFSLFIFICLLIPSLQAVIVLTSHRSSSVLISAPILKISLMAHILVGIVYSLFMIANIEGLIPMVHRPWLTGTDAANLLIQKYVAFPILSDTSASLWMPHEKLNLLQSISLDAYLWVRVSFLQVLFAALIVISVRFVSNALVFHINCGLSFPFIQKRQLFGFVESVGDQSRVKDICFAKTCQWQLSG